MELEKRNQDPIDRREFNELQSAKQEGVKLKKEIASIVNKKDGGIEDMMHLRQQPKTNK